MYKLNIKTTQKYQNHFDVTSSLRMTIIINRNDFSYNCLSFMA